MNKTIIIALIITIINVTTLGALYAATNSGLTKEQERAINELIDKRVEQRLDKLRDCLRSRCCDRDTSTGRALSEALWYCVK